MINTAKTMRNLRDHLAEAMKNQRAADLIAAKCGCHKATLYNFVRGKSQPRADLFLNLINALGLEPMEVIHVRDDTSVAEHRRTAVGGAARAAASVSELSAEPRAEDLADLL